MAGTVYSLFFWQDYANDPKLKRCSVGAQALWMRMLCLAAESGTPGHVLIGTEIPADADFSDTFGTRAFPVDKVKTWREELIKKEVCDVGRKGVLINRRMVRDAQKRRRNASGGKKASTTTPRNDKGIYTGRSTDHRVHTPLPESTSQLPEQTDLLAEYAKALGRNINALTSTPFGWVDQMLAMQESGIDLELDLFAVVREIAAAGRLPDADALSAGPKLFGKLADRRARARMITATRPKLELVPDVAPNLTEQEWYQALRSLLMVGAWIKSTWGPSPFEEGCKAPPDMLAKAQVQWEKQGNLPSSVLVGNAYLAWEPRYKQYSLIQEPRPFHARAAA